MIPRLIRDAGYEIHSEKSNIAGIVGTGLHATAFLVMSEKIKGFKVNLNDATDVGVASVKKGIIESDIIVWDNTTPNPNHAEQQVVQLSKSFFYDVAPKIEPEDVEVYRKATIADDYELSGHCDIETVGDEILDWKTSLRTYHAQYGAYSLLRRSNDKSKATKCGTLYLPRTALKKVYPGAQRLEYPVDACEREAHTRIKYIIRDIENFRRIQNPAAFPCNPMSMMCGEKYCPAFGTPWCEISIK